VLKAGWATRNLIAARVKLSSSAAATKYRRCLSSIHSPYLKLMAGPRNKVLGEFNWQPYYIIRMNETQTTTPTELKTVTRTTCLLSRVNPLDSFKSSKDSHSPELVRRISPLRQAALWLTAIALLGLFAYAGFRYVVNARSLVKTDNAYLTAHTHMISSRVAGIIKEVLIEENQFVAAGTVLARLDPADFEVRRQQAAAQAAQARAHLQECAALISQAQAQIIRDQARATRTSNDLARASSLFERGSGAIARQELDLAQAEADAADASLQATRSGLDSAIATAAAAKALQAVADAGLENANLQLSYTEILAPVAGHVGRKNLETGNHVQPGQPFLALVQPDVWVNANFKETQLANLKPAQPVRIRIDAFPGRTFRGWVDSLSPASGAQFALLPPDNATGNFTKIVQRVPVRIVLDRASLGDCEGRLVAGMSAVVEVRVK
jgi:membrane fusion protein (multidrug efflux system)